MTVRRLWRAISEPRHLKVTYWAFYAIAFLTGMGTLISPPRYIEGEIGPVLTMLWALFVVIGGIGGALSVLPGWWWAERLSIVLIWVGSAIYIIVVLNPHMAIEGTDPAQLGWITLGSCLFFVRWLLIRKYTFEPRPRR